MHPKRPTTIFTATAVSALAVAIVMGATPVRAADDNDSIDNKLIRGLLQGLGLRKGDEASIVYQERAPLVIPQNQDLPPPERGNVTTNNPAWPKDPDVARAREAERLERNRNIEQEQLTELNPLRPDQMTPGAKGRTTARRSGAASGSAPVSTEAERMSPSELGYKGGLFSNMFGSKDDETVRFTGEPPRTSLTAPPSGYQTPSPDQPYGLTKRVEAPKAENSMLDRGAAR